MKKHFSFLIALGSIYANFSYASPALICPTTITCSTSANRYVPECKNMPTEWTMGISGVDRRIVNDRDYVLHFTGATIDADEYANCVYNLIGASDVVFSVAIHSLDVQSRKDSTLAWKEIPFEPFQAYTEYCFTLDPYSKIARDPAMCLLSPVVRSE